jgi:hypothetical protein
VGSLVEGARIEVVSTGSLRVSPSVWKPLVLFSANDNDLGQVASLLNAPVNLRGMIRGGGLFEVLRYGLQQVRVGLLDRLDGTGYYSFWPES